MSPNNQANLAETFDRQRLTFVCLIMLMGLKTGLNALSYYFSRSDYQWMNFAHLAVAFSLMGVFMVILFNLVQITRLSSGDRLCSKRMMLDSFIEKTNTYALAGSWFITFLTIAMLEEWSETDVNYFGQHDISSLLPMRYYISLLLSCMTLSYSLIFFVMYLKSNAADNGDTA